MNKRNIIKIITLLASVLFIVRIAVAQETPPSSPGSSVTDKPGEASNAKIIVPVVKENTSVKAVNTNSVIANTLKTTDIEKKDIKGADEADIGLGEEEFIEITDNNEEIPGAVAEISKTEENLISITLDDVEMIDVVRMFTRISGANIIATPSNLLGRVTVNLNDVEWQPALTSILDMHNLAIVEKTPGSSVYSILPKQPGAPEPLIVDTLFLRYASVSNVYKVISSMLVPGGSVSSFSSRNALIVRTTSANMGEIKQIIENIDILRDQVFIEAKFLELNDSAIKDLGINWQVLQGFGVGLSSLQRSYDENRTWTDSRNDASSDWDKRNNVDQANDRYDINGLKYEEDTTTYEESPPDSGNWIANTVITPTRTLTDTIDKGKNITRDISKDFGKTITDIKTAVLGVDDFRLVLSALKQLNGVTMVSNPKIIVANEEPAIIHIGQTERPFISSVTPGQQGIAPVVTYNPGDPVDFGVKLTVTPTVNTESNITVKIEPELTRFLENDIAPNGQTYPIIARKTIRTVFCLESGKTVAIGGMTDTKDRDKTTKIPLLGNIPIIGKYLFSYTHKVTEQKETIIFVTVGLALPDKMKKEEGLPENTKLTQRHLLRSAVKRLQAKENIEKLKKSTDKKIDKIKARLLKKRR